MSSRITLFIPRSSTHELCTLDKLLQFYFNFLLHTPKIRRTRDLSESDTVIAYPTATTHTLLKVFTALSSSYVLGPRIIKNGTL